MVTINVTKLTAEIYMPDNACEYAIANRNKCSLPLAVVMSIDCKLHSCGAVRTIGASGHQFRIRTIAEWRSDMVKAACVVYCAYKLRR